MDAIGRISQINSFSVGAPGSVQLRLPGQKSFHPSPLVQLFFLPASLLVGDQAVQQPMNEKAVPPSIVVVQPVLAISPTVGERKVGQPNYIRDLLALTHGQ